MKDFFGWVLVVTRRYSSYSEASRTKRGIYALCMFLNLYLAGFLLSALVVSNRIGLLDLFKEYITGDTFVNIFMGVYFLVSFFTLFALKRTYKDDVISFYINKYAPKNKQEGKNQILIVCLFLIGGPACLFLPKIII